MTASLRRWTRRRKPNHVSYRVAAIRRHGGANLGAVPLDILGENRIREMVVVALFLVIQFQSFKRFQQFQSLRSQFCFKSCKQL